MIFLVQVIPASAASAAAVERVLDSEVDWYRYRAGCYLVVSRGNASTLTDRLRVLIKDEDSLLVLGVDPRRRQGWMPADFWAWLRRHA